MRYFFAISSCGLALLAAASSAGPQKMTARAPIVLPVTVPILDVKSGYLLGGRRSGKWIDAKTTARALKSGQIYRVFSATRALGKSRATLPKSQGAPCPDTLWSQISPNFSRQNAEFALGGAHSPLARAIRVENSGQASYRKIVASILESRGIARPQVQIQQIWRVDLDGDGASEVLLSATRKADFGDPDSIAPASRAGDYSLVLLRKIAGGKVENLLLQGEFHPRKQQFNAPAFYRLAAVFDGDGDGKMEVLIRGRYYEGDWTSLYQMRGEKPRKVLTEGCGT